MHAQRARRELWPVLLGVLPADLRSPDSVEPRRALKRAYQDLVLQWENLERGKELLEDTPERQAIAKNISQEKWTEVRCAHSSTAGHTS